MNRFFYSLLLYLALPFVPLKLLWRGLKQPAYLKHWGERFGFYSTPVNRPIIWLHCVSVGETRAAEPLIKALLQQYPNHQILVTHTTPTGRETSETLLGDKVQRVYLPYDLPFAVNNFLGHFKPKIGILMETELWFNLIAACKQRDIPLLLLNARLSEKSAEGYAKLGKLAAEGLQNLSAIAAQSAEDLTRLQALGAGNISVAGNLKFDVKPPADSVDKGLQLREVLGAKRTIFLAASTRKGEEKHILEAVKGLDVLTVIVPRHPQRFNEVEGIIQQSGLTYQRRSNLVGAVDKNIQVILGDSMGELFTYYAACDFTFIGGSLRKYGGQNLIEAASMGKPILIGKHTFNFTDATNNAIRAGAAIRVKDDAELRDRIQYLLHNQPKQIKMQQAALHFSEASTGATTRMTKLIAQYLR
jgi:3-deoxy-D-manno-octulosonic-acid transferase